MAGISMTIRMRRAGQLVGETPSNPAGPRADGTYKPGRVREPEVVAPPASVAQLRNLVDRSERHRLSAAEVSRLREGLDALAARDARVTALAGVLEADDPDGMTRRGVAAHLIRNAQTEERA